MKLEYAAVTPAISFKYKYTKVYNKNILNICMKGFGSQNIIVDKMKAIIQL